MSIPLPIALALVPVVFFAGAFAFRKNPLLGAKTLDELESVYQREKKRLS